MGECPDLSSSGYVITIDQRYDFYFYVSLHDKGYKGAVWNKTQSCYKKYVSITEGVEGRATLALTRTAQRQLHVNQHIAPYHSLRTVGPTIYIDQRI